MIESPIVKDQSLGWFVKVSVQQLTQLPEDLYIPPDALRVFLDAFEACLSNSGHGLYVNKAHYLQGVERTGGVLLLRIILGY